MLGFRYTRARLALGAFLLVVGALLVRPQVAAATPPPAGSAANVEPNGFTVEKLVRGLTLRDYNTRVVVIGIVLLGAAAGVIGCFAYLRGRAMLGDALSHATLPGIAIAFMLTGEKNLPVLLLGAAATGVLGVGAVTALRYVPRIREDAAIGIVLSVFFGAGMVLLSLVQQMGLGQEAGLQSFVYGKAAAMIKQDAIRIGIAALVVCVATILFYKEFRAVCFDKSFAAAQGTPVLFVDLLMMGLVVLITVVGLQAVGLILVVALLIIPAAAARFWTDRLLSMTLLAGLFGACSGWLGATSSSMAPKLPTGALVVIAAGVLFLISMLFSPNRGVLAEVTRRFGLARRMSIQHLLRALAEIEEDQGEGKRIAFTGVQRKRSWTSMQLRRVIARAGRRGFTVVGPESCLRLTERGRVAAQRVLRNHRLWEMYLISYADIAPSHVDRDADDVEHVLSEGVIRELELALSQQVSIPPSPHLEGDPA